MWAAVAIGGASLISGVIGANAAGSAASQQAAAAQNAQNIGLQEFNTITGQQQPFMNAGYGALGQLNYLLGQGTPGTGGASGTAASSSAGGYGSLLSPFTAQTMAEYSPAYNFQMQQGRQGVLNGDAAGTGVLSGAAQKDLMGYNQNFANTAFNNAFNQYQAQQGNIYSRLSGVANLGQNVARQCRSARDRTCRSASSSRAECRDSVSRWDGGSGECLFECATGRLLRAIPQQLRRWWGQWWNHALPRSYGRHWQYCRS